MLNKVPEVILFFWIIKVPRSVSRWLHVDLPHRVAHLGLPVTTVVARERNPANISEDSVAPARA